MHEILVELKNRRLLEEGFNPYAPGAITRGLQLIRYQSCLYTPREQTEGSGDFGYKRCEELRMELFEKMNKPRPPSSEDLTLKYPLV